MKKTIEILWTGGYDSTFRMCQLSRKNVIIQPYYVSNNKRKSEGNELNAIKIITEKLRNNKNTLAEIKDYIYIDIDESKNDIEIINAYNNLLKLEYIGHQYVWLGTFALQHNGIEMSIHKDDKAINLIQKFGKLKIETDETGDYYVVDKDNSSSDCVALFRNLHFPLANYTKLEMKKEYEKMGLEDIINDTWFCHTPIKGKPCGICNPCKYTIEEGMSFRLPKTALKRYKRNKNIIFRNVYKLIHKIKRKLGR